VSDLPLPLRLRRCETIKATRSNVSPLARSSKRVQLRVSPLGLFLMTRNKALSLRAPLRWCPLTTRVGNEFSRGQATFSSLHPRKNASSRLRCGSLNLRRRTNLDPPMDTFPIDFAVRSPASRRSRYSTVRRKAGCWIRPTPWRGSAARRSGSHGNPRAWISKWIPPLAIRDGY